MLGKPTLKDRNEEEVRGYREALKVIHEHSGDLLVTEETIRDLHRLSRGEIWDAGKYKEKDVDIIEFFPGGGSRNGPQRNLEAARMKQGKIALTG